MPAARRPGAVTAVHLLLTDPGGRLLLLRRHGTGYRDGWFSVPAGHVEPGEAPVAAMRREAHEEIGVELPEHLPDPLLVYRGCADGPRIDLFLAAEGLGVAAVNREPHKCSELVRHHPDALPDRVVPYVRAAVAAHRSGRRYLEYGWSPGDEPD